MRGNKKLGVDEDTIQQLHTYDWAQFKSEWRLFGTVGRRACIHRMNDCKGHGFFHMLAADVHAIHMRLYRLRKN